MNHTVSNSKAAAENRILLLENIHSAAVEAFRDSGFSQIETQSGSPSEEQLIQRLRDIQILGIRSKTEITERVLDSAPGLLAVGCFCIGTDQVDMDAATRRGVAVFNAPFSNTRSVAELTIAEVVMLARRAVQRSMELHHGRWEKSAKGCMEVRRKTIGIVGYGHIGPQVGLLAEALGMKVVFHDINKKLPLGNARQLSGLEELLKNYRRASGTMAEVFGPRQLRNDVLQRLFRHEEISREKYGLLDPKTRAITFRLSSMFACAYRALAVRVRCPMLAMINC